MATRILLLPENAAYPATNFPQFKYDAQRRPVLSYDTATSETAYWTAVIPQGWTGTVVAVISYKMASATSGGVAFDIAVEAVTSGDAVDLDAGTSWDTVNAGNDAAVPGTAGYMEQLSITLTNLDSAAEADYVRFSVARDVADGADTAAGVYFLTLTANNENASLTETIKMLKLKIIPPGRIMFVPAFVVLAVRAEQTRVFQRLW